MKKQQLLDLLADHAEALNRENDPERLSPEAWIASQDHSDLGHLLWLLQLAQAIKMALVPVTTPTSFRSDLRHRLASETGDLLDTMKRPYRWIVVLSAAAIGLAVLVLRVLKLLPRQSQSRPMTTAV